MLIAIDHGNKQIKTVHTQPFTSGLIQGDTPGFGTDCLAYQGKYYTLTDQRIPYRRDKTEDERFFILTLFAIAYEIEAMGRYSDTLMRIQLAVGLPPAHLSTILMDGAPFHFNSAANRMPFILKIQPAFRSHFPRPLRR